ncbi:MAG TPA: hypothetical protein DCG49_02250 [Ruminococcus sp.]|nr:hypothetical protein [Ruminococcus sp.]
MKLGYRDRVILLIAIVAVIFIIAIFAFIRPKLEDLNNNKQALEGVKTEWETKVIEFDRIPAKQKTIKARYQESLDISKGFTDEMDGLGLENFVREGFVNIDQFIGDGVLMTESLNVTDETAATLGYYFYAPNIVTYPLYENADLDGSLALEAASKLLESNVLSARSAQTVSNGTHTVKLIINQTDVLDLLDSIKAYADANNDAMMITNVVTKDYYRFNQNTAAPTPQLDDEGNPIPGTGGTAEGDDMKPGYTEVTITYKSIYMQEPTEPDVGPAYDKTIWDGEEWRDPVAE